ncbi:MAG TPA: hypothetical protein VM597_14415 [Gemmataceae bacterium]|nr:hypothetical protein [Gemmataceae bacterium]
MARTSHVRLALIAVGSLLGILAFIQPGHSQPGGPPGGGFRGGGPGLPQLPGPPGRPPGFPEIPRPEFPRPPMIPRPEIPRPPTFPGGIGGGIGGIPGPGISEWKCGQCGRVLGTGPIPPPPGVTCPTCGTKNYPPGSAPPGGIGGGIGGGVPPGFTPPAVPPNMPPPPVFNGQPPRAAQAPQIVVDESGGGYGVAPDPEFTDPRSRSVLKWLGVAIGILLFLVVGVVILCVALANQPQRRPRRRRRPRDDDY